MRKKIVLMALGVILLALITSGAWWLFSTGRLTYVDSGAQSKSTAAICGSDIVEKYNSAMYFVQRDGSAEPSVDEAGIKSLTAQIKSEAKYETDPTCQTILFWTAAHNKDYQGALAAYKAIKKLHDSRMFADSNLRSNEPLFTYERYVNSLSPANTQVNEGSGE